MRFSSPASAPAISATSSRPDGSAGARSNAERGSCAQSRAADDGIARFRAWIADSDLGAAKLHHPLLLKVYFAHWLGPRSGYAARLAKGATRMKTGPRSATALRGATLRYGIGRIDAELAWIAEVRASLG